MLEEEGDGEGSREVSESEDFGITDYTANQFDVHERTSHFMERRPISANNRIAVEAIYMVETLTIVKSMKTMHKAEVALHLQERYKAFIRAIPLTRFAEPSLKVKMEEK
jgi:hypothetical protein